MRTETNGILIDEETGVPYLMQGGAASNLMGLKHLSSTGGRLPNHRCPHDFDLTRGTPCAEDLVWYLKWRQDPLMDFMLPNPRTESRCLGFFPAANNFRLNKLIIKLTELQNIKKNSSMCVAVQGVGGIKDSLIERNSNIVTLIFQGLKLKDSPFLDECCVRAMGVSNKVIFVGDRDCLYDHQLIPTIKTNLDIDKLPKDLALIGNYHLKLLLGGKNVQYTKYEDHVRDDILDLVPSGSGVWFDNNDPENITQLPDLHR